MISGSSEAVGEPRRASDPRRSQNSNVERRSQNTKIERKWQQTDTLPSLSETDAENVQIANYKI